MKDRCDILKDFLWTGRQMKGNGQNNSARDLGDPWRYVNICLFILFCPSFQSDHGDSYHAVPERLHPLDRHMENPFGTKDEKAGRGTSRLTHV